MSRSLVFVVHDFSLYFCSFVPVNFTLHTSAHPSPPRHLHSFSQELIPYLPHLERWVDSWKQPDVSESLKELCYIVAHELASVDESLLKTHLSVDSREAATLEWLHKYLLKETEVSPKLSEAVAWFCRLIIGTPNVYEVENWIEVPVLEKVGWDCYAFGGEWEK